MRAFLGWGSCDPGINLYLLFDAMLVNGVATYRLACILGSMCGSPTCGLAILERVRDDSQWLETIRVI